MSLNLVFRGRDVEMSAELDARNPIYLGRGRCCELVVEHPTVSERHAELRLESERLVLQDLKSANGTFINDVRTSRDFVLPGDRIRLGSAELVLFLEGTSLGNLGDGQARELSDSLNGTVLSGVAENLSPADLVQLLAANGKTGTLMLFNGRFGRIDFKEGCVCYAKVDPVEGEKAFHRILGWSGAEFQFRYHWPKQENIESSTNELLIDHVRHHDEMLTLETVLPSPETELTLKPGGTMGTLSVIEKEILRVTPEVKILARVMDLSPHLDVEIARSVIRLLEAGLLAPLIHNATSRG
jgi:pSer/pThr/pTyr-binding forkhead associated (FHA) protein